jgi:hypothetical protein
MNSYGIVTMVRPSCQGWCCISAGYSNLPEVKMPPVEFESMFQFLVRKELFQGCDSIQDGRCEFPSFWNLKHGSCIGRDFTLLLLSGYHRMY